LGMLTPFLKKTQMPIPGYFRGLTAVLNKNQNNLKVIPNPPKNTKVFFFRLIRSTN